MRESFFFLIFLFVFKWVQSQSSFNKSIDATDLTEIFITLDNTFQIEVTNTSENKIIVTAVSEGEYQNKVFINTKREENSLSIIDDIQPFSENHNDKLSAHKLIVLKVKIQLPKHLNVIITSRLASLNLNAKTKSLLVELNSGDCFLNNFIGNAVINTLDGSITIYTKNATIKASTKKGILFAEKIFGEHLVELKSISGDISVYKTK